MSKADFSAQKGKEMFSTGLLSTLCDLMFYSPAATVKRGAVWRWPKCSAAPHCSDSKEAAPPYSMYRNKELLLFPHSTPAHPSLALLILVSFGMKESGQAKDPIKFIWDSDAPGVLLQSS